MRIGYSFWGFIGPGITDTPDGGRSHRATLIDALGGITRDDYRRVPIGGGPHAKLYGYV